MYCLFLDYYSSITRDEEIPIDISTYSKYFNHYMNFSFRLPRTDVCDVCFSFENDKKDKEVYDDHVARFEQYKVFKKEMLQKKNVLHIKFDFGQNLPCPKIPVNSQFLLSFAVTIYFQCPCSPQLKQLYVLFSRRNVKKRCKYGLQFDLLCYLWRIKNGLLQWDLYVLWRCWWPE